MVRTQNSPSLGQHLLLQDLVDAGPRALRQHGDHVGERGRLLAQRAVLRARARHLPPQPGHALRQPPLHLALRQRAHVPARARRTPPWAELCR